MGRSPPGEDRPRRFYKDAGVVRREDGFAVALDERTARTPAGAPLVLPREPLARLVAGEWAGQGEEIDFAFMPAHRLAATVIDRTASAGPALAAEVARYAGADVLCYFADAPDALVREEEARWTPLLDWAREALGIDLRRVSGIVHEAQPPEALARVCALVAGLEPFAQAAVAYAAPLFGSAVLALAVERGRLGAEEAFDLSRLDEAFQESRWGVDADAALRTGRLREEARFLDRWFAALR